MKKNAILLFILFCAVTFAQSDNNKQENYLSGANVISVTIGGKFLVTGSFPASITERVNQFVSRMFSTAKEKLVLKDRDFGRYDYSFRNILLKRADGSKLILDLEKFKLNGDFANNPYLKNDDVLIFPQTDIERNFFSVTGAVNNPEKFHFVDGDKLKDALELAGGINKAYENVTKAEINRLSYDGRELNAISVDINSDYPLQRGDRIVVVANETMKKNYFVKIIGEVNNPGIIPITKDKTTLFEAINKAGGLTNSASLIQAKLFTGNSIHALVMKGYKLKEDEYFSKTDEELFTMVSTLEELEMLRMSNVVPEDTGYFKLENLLRVQTEHSAVDFTRLNDPNSDASKYLVKDNDLIIIPAKSTTVYVFGQVPGQGHIPYVKGKDYMYYISQAGGLGEFAESGDVMIIKGNSRNWIEANRNVVIEEGDYIYIPRRPARSFNSYVSQYANYLSIIASVATVILLLYQFKK